MHALATENYKSSVKKPIDDVRGLFTTAEWKNVSKHRFLYPNRLLWSVCGVVLRRCSNVPRSKIRLGKIHFGQFSERAKEERPLVIKSCLEVQRAFIEEVFLRENTKAELRKGFACANSDSLIGIPAIDLLYYYGSK